MTGIESLSKIRDEAARENILRITDSFVAAVNPMKVILFGSFADGTYTDDSDYVFYLVVESGVSLHDTCYKAHRAITDLKDRPADIVVGHDFYFEQKGKMKNTLMVEGEVHKKGIVLYDRHMRRNHVSPVQTTCLTINTTEHMETAEQRA